MPVEGRIPIIMYQMIIVNGPHLPRKNLYADKCCL